ncbi:hypothetical protein LCGC14_0568740 [marine sediment metagenome]|uniref:Uncharacterized protein n=1 Tax=marine sediment metagenome TaxID=412755 RepID=A0A0F9UT49_9ZZZZ|nr:hypothetical protein [Phycisphaerae bacterium]
MSKRKDKTYYMHTMDGKPAGFRRSEGTVLFAWAGVPLAASLKQVRTEQQQSRDWDKAQGGHVSYNYGYIRVRVAEGE